MTAVPLTSETSAMLSIRWEHGYQGEQREMSICPIPPVAAHVSFHLYEEERHE